MRIAPTLTLTLTLIPLACTACRRDKVEANDTEEPVSYEAWWPEWAWGHWVWEDESTQDSVAALVAGYQDNDIPIDAVIIDSPWETSYDSFEWDNALFPDPAAMVDALHADGVHVLVWIVPMMNTAAGDLYDEGAEKGYYLLDKEGGDALVYDWWKGPGSPIDYWNPDAVAWWHDLMQPVLDLGIDGWKTDGAEFQLLLSKGWSAGAGREIKRPEYSHAYYRDFYEHTREVLGDERLIMARPIDNYGADIGGDNVAFAPVDINIAGWVGDQDASFDGLRLALRNYYWSADYGYLAFGSDIGGYRDDDAYALGRDTELFVRWAQLGALSPLMENGGGGNHEPWLFGDEVLTIYRDFVNLHNSLLPYMRQQGAIAYAEGRSLFTFLDDETYTYLLGEDLFVAPVLSAGTSHVVEFPDSGQWRWLFGDQAVYEAGSKATLDVPLDSFPVFVRVDSDLESSLLAR